MSGNIDDLAALIREAEGSRERFLEKFAVFCEQAFPRQTAVSRRARGWLKRTVEIEGLSLRFETRVFELRREGAAVVAEIAHEVRGVVISRNAATARDALNEADRKILGLVADGALDAARTTASSRGVDPRQMEALAQAADKVTQALGEMAQHDRLAAARAQEQEKELHQLRDRLATSMRSLAQQSVQPLGQP